jgi:hypothetical protein
MIQHEEEANSTAERRVPIQANMMQVKMESLIAEEWNLIEPCLFKINVLLVV